MKRFEELTEDEKHQFWADRCADVRDFIQRFSDSIDAGTQGTALNFVEHNEYGVAMDLVVDVLIDSGHRFESGDVDAIRRFYLLIAHPEEKVDMLVVALRESG